MKINEDRDHIIFECSGRKAYAFGGVIGLAVKPPADERAHERIVYGWDDRLKAEFDESNDDDNHRDLTVQEMCELAEFMVAQWMAFRNSLPVSTQQPDTWHAAEAAECDGDHPVWARRLDRGAPQLARVR